MNEDFFERLARELGRKHEDEDTYGRRAWPAPAEDGSMLHVRVDDAGDTWWTVVDRHGEVRSEQVLAPGVPDSAYT